MTPREFFERLYGDDYPGHLMVCHRDGAMRAAAFTCERLAEACAHAVERGQAYDTWYGVGLQSEAPAGGSRGTADGVGAIPGLWADIDIRCDNHKAKALPESIEEARVLLTTFPLKPSLIIRTGGGLHCYWLFPELWRFESVEERSKAAILSRRFQATLRKHAHARGWKLDSTHDLARLLRIPGTQNHKGAEPRPVEILEQNELRYSPEDFEPYIAVETVKDNAPWARANGDGKKTGDGRPKPDFAGDPPAIEPILAGCAWLRHCREDAARLTEPEWYGAIGIVARCQRGRELAHEWSSPYPDYSVPECDKKIDHALSASGPLRCTTIAERFGGEDCEACPARGLVSSPIVLARMEDVRAKILELLDRILEKKAPKENSILSTDDEDATAAPLPPEESGDAVDPGGDNPREELERLIESSSPAYKETVKILALLDLDTARHKILAESAVKVRGFAKVLADVLVFVGEHFAVDGGKKLYRYTGGVYRDDGEAFVSARTKAMLEAWATTKSWHTRKTSEVVAYLAVDAPRLWERPPLEIVNVKNGLLQWRTKELRPHSPEHLCPTQIPVAFDSAAACPAWERFCREVFPEDVVAAGVPWQIAGWLIIPFTGLQKAVLCLGSGANGKSRFLSGLVRFVGPENVAARALQELEENRFAAADLYGRLVNCVADLPGRSMQGTSTFKALTGEDPKILCDRKFRDAFEFRPYTRMIFSANSPPRCIDDDSAFYRRWLCLDFPNHFGGGEDDDPPARTSSQIDAELSDPRELSGLLNRAIVALPDVVERGITETDSMMAALTGFQFTSAPDITAWLETNCQVAGNLAVIKKELLGEFNRFADAKGIPRATPHGMTASVKNLPGKVFESRRRCLSVTGELLENQRCWVGIGLRPLRARAPDGVPPGFGGREAP